MIAKKTVKMYFIGVFTALLIAIFLYSFNTSNTPSYVTVAKAIDYNNGYNYTYMFFKIYKNGNINIEWRDGEGDVISAIYQDISEPKENKNIKLDFKQNIKMQKALRELKNTRPNETAHAARLGEYEYSAKIGENVYGHVPKFFEYYSGTKTKYINENLQYVVDMLLEFSAVEI